MIHDWTYDTSWILMRNQLEHPNNCQHPLAWQEHPRPVLWSLWWFSIWRMEPSDIQHQNDQTTYCWFAVIGGNDDKKKHNRRHVKIEKKCRKMLNTCEKGSKISLKEQDNNRFGSHFLPANRTPWSWPAVLDPKLAIWTTSEGVHKATICQC